MSKFSPLFWPITLKDEVISILDETRLPQKLTYIKVSNYRGSCVAIRQMKTRAVGQVLLVFYTFLMVLRQNKGKKDQLALLKKVASALVVTRPTLPFRFLTDMVLGWASQAPLSLEKNILGFLELLKHKRMQQAEEASALIKDGDTILTHCNVSGLMPLIADYAKEKDKGINFFVTETRPYLQGARLTAWELKRAGYQVTVIADNTVAHVMSEGKINRVIVGADHLAANGDIANKIGTYQIALLAKIFGIPFYVLCPPASGAKSGKEIAIEVRPQKELLEYQGIRLAPSGVRGYNPAFDVTPHQLITKHIYLVV